MSNPYREPGEVKSTLSQDLRAATRDARAGYPDPLQSAIAECWRAARNGRGFASFSGAHELSEEFVTGLRGHGLRVIWEAGTPAHSERVTVVWDQAWERFDAVYAPHGEKFPAAEPEGEIDVEG